MKRKKVDKRMAALGRLLKRWEKLADLYASFSTVAASAIRIRVAELRAALKTK